MILARAAVVAALFGLAVALRFYGIAGESFWTDEVLSVHCSNGSIAQVVQRNARDGRHPLYYVGLSLWRKALGDSDGRMRAYGAAWSLVGILAVFLLARGIGGWPAALIALLLAAVNPLDVYFAQEARNYTQTAALCALGAWCLWRWMTVADDARARARWWPWAAGYAVCAAAAVLTHYLSAVVLTAQGIFALAWFARRKRWGSVAGYAACAGVAVLASVPWFFYVRQVRGSSRLATPEWMQLPVPGDFVSFLGREFFWGNVWTAHDRWWRYTILLSVFVLGVGAWHLLRERRRGRASLTKDRSLGMAYLLWLLAGPVLLAALCSVAYRPIYYRLRFAELVVLPFLALAGTACAALRGRAAMAVTSAALGAAMLTGTIVQHRTTQKTDWRSFARVWREQGPPAGAVFFPWFFDQAAGYYLRQPLVSPAREEMAKRLPQLGGADVWICFEKGYPFNRAPGEADYYQWLISLGAAHAIALPTNLDLQVVTVGTTAVPEPYRSRFAQWYGPVDRAGQIEGFGARERFHAQEFDGDGTAFRWSWPRAWLRLGETDKAATVVLNVQLPPLVNAAYRPDLRVYALRGEDAAGLFDSPPVAQVGAYRAGAFEVPVAVPPGDGSLWLGWTLNGVNLRTAAGSSDSRDLGLRVNWVGQ